MRCRERGEVDRLYPVEEATAVEHADRISRDETAQTVACDTDLANGVSILFQLGKLLFNLVGHSFSAHLDAIVGLVVAYTCRDEDVQVIFGVLLAQRVANKV